MNDPSRDIDDIPALAAWPSEFLGEIFERTLNEIFVFDAESLQFLHANRGARNNLGYSLAELIEMTPVDIKPDFDTPAFLKLIEPLRGQDDVLVFETRHRRKDASHYPVEVHLQHVSLNDTGVFAAIIVDITERKLAERELRGANATLDQRVRNRTQNLEELNSRLEEREQDLERIFDAAPDAIVLVDREGLIERVNSQAVKLFGYSKQELQNQRIELLVPERFRSTHVGHRDDFAARPRVREMGATLDLYARRKDGTELSIDVNLSPIEFGGRSLVSAAIRDYSEHRAFQDALKEAKEQSDRATSAKSRFLATASHDLRQPLQSLGLYLAVLVRQTADEKALEIAAKMRNSLDAMGDLLDALLDISKFESGAIVPELRDIEVRDIFERIAADNAPVAEKKGLDFSIETTPLVIHSDPAMLQRIVENFVTNAIRYTEAGKVEVTCIENGDSARIEVSDTGIGIPEDALEIIFDEYYQLDNQVRDRNQGLGIGLAIVKYIAQLLGHELNVWSEPGKGSRFSVSVPVVEGATRNADRSEPETTARPHRSLAVLLIDDDAAIVDATAMLLQSEGFVVFTAPDGSNALAQCRNGVRPDVVVSDYRLPGLSGIDVIRELRAMGDPQLPAILMTGDTTTRKISEENLTDCEVLHKPVNTDRLIALIRESA